MSIFGLCVLCHLLRRHHHRRRCHCQPTMAIHPARNGIVICKCWPSDQVRSCVKIPQRFMCHLHRVGESERARERETRTKQMLDLMNIKNLRFKQAFVFFHWFLRQIHVLFFLCRPFNSHSDQPDEWMNWNRASDCECQPTMRTHTHTRREN